MKNMTDKIIIENQELLVLLSFDDYEYKRITICLKENNQRVFVINNKIITDETIINAINKKYGLEVPNEIKKGFIIKD